MAERSWQVWADMLARESMEAASGRPTREYISAPDFIAAVHAAAVKTREMLIGNLILKMTSPDEPGFRDVEAVVEGLVKIGAARLSGAATGDEVRQWNELVAQALRGHGSLTSRGRPTH